MTLANRGWAEFRNHPTVIKLVMTVNHVSNATPSDRSSSRIVLAGAASANGRHVFPPLRVTRFLQTQSSCYVWIFPELGYSLLYRTPNLVGNRRLFKGRTDCENVKVGIIETDVDLTSHSARFLSVRLGC
jgi:hypothetical protein